MWAIPPFGFLEGKQGGKRVIIVGAAADSGGSKREGEKGSGLTFFGSLKGRSHSCKHAGRVGERGLVSHLVLFLEKRKTDRNETTGDRFFDCNAKRPLQGQLQATITSNHIYGSKEFMVPSSNSTRE